MDDTTRFIGRLLSSLKFWEWRRRGAHLSTRTSDHRWATHADRHSAGARERRKARRKMAAASRARNRKARVM